MVDSSEVDSIVRQRAFQFLDELRAAHGDALPRELLAKGFEFEGRRIPLVGPQGIFKPAATIMPLSITTVPASSRKERPYEDRIDEGGTVIHYKYRGTNASHPDNVGLREAMRHQVPLIYFVGLVPGRYFADYPVFIVGDDPSDLTFEVQVDDSRVVVGASSVADAMTTARRDYITVLAQRRVHQEEFRARVLRAYRECCAVCRLGHRELLDGAHILPDKHPRGHPVVPNGLSLCKIHHAAFDGNFLGIRPDLVVEIRHDILEEKDGPMLLHGLQRLHGQVLQVVPQSRDLKPDPERLEERYEQFRNTG